MTLLCEKIIFTLFLTWKISFFFTKDTPNLPSVGQRSKYSFARQWLSCRYFYDTDLMINVFMPFAQILQELPCSIVQAFAAPPALSLSPEWSWNKKIKNIINLLYWRCNMKNVSIFINVANVDKSKY